MLNTMRNSLSRFLGRSVLPYQLLSSSAKLETASDDGSFCALMWGGSAPLNLCWPPWTGKNWWWDLPGQLSSTTSEGKKEKEEKFHGNQFISLPCQRGRVTEVRGALGPHVGGLALLEDPAPPLAPISEVFKGVTNKKLLLNYMISKAWREIKNQPTSQVFYYLC